MHVYILLETKSLLLKRSWGPKGMLGQISTLIGVAENMDQRMNQSDSFPGVIYVYIIAIGYVSISDLSKYLGLKCRVEIC